MTPDWLMLFAKGIMCNFLVCLAVWIAYASKTVVDKAIGIMLPIAAFVACGFEHCVANMFFLPMGILLSSVGVVAPASIPRFSRGRVRCGTGAPPFPGTSSAAPFSSEWRIGLPIAGPRSRVLANTFRAERRYVRSMYVRIRTQKAHRERSRRS